MFGKYKYKPCQCSCHCKKGAECKCTCPSDGKIIKENKEWKEIYIILHNVYEKLRQENERLKADVIYWQEESSQVRKNESHLLRILDDRDKQIEQLKAQLQQNNEFMGSIRTQAQVQQKEHHNSHNFCQAYECKVCNPDKGKCKTCKDCGMVMPSMTHAADRCPDCSPEPHKCPVCLGTLFHPIFTPNEFVCLGCKGTGIKREAKQ